MAELRIRDDWASGTANRTVQPEWLGWSCRSVFERATQQLTDEIHGVAAINQKAHLPGSLASITRELPGKLALPGFPQTVSPIDTAVAQRLVDISSGQAALGEVITDALRAEARARPITDEAFQITRFG